MLGLSHQFLVDYDDGSGGGLDLRSSPVLGPELTSNVTPMLTAAPGPALTGGALPTQNPAPEHGRIADLHSKGNPPPAEEQKQAVPPDSSTAHTDDHRAAPPPAARRRLSTSVPTGTGMFNVLRRRPPTTGVLARFGPGPELEEEEEAEPVVGTVGAGTGGRSMLTMQLRREQDMAQEIARMQSSRSGGGGMVRFQSRGTVTANRGAGRRPSRLSSHFERRNNTRGENLMMAHRKGHAPGDKNSSVTHNRQSTGGSTPAGGAGKRIQLWLNIPKGLLPDSTTPPADAQDCYEPHGFWLQVTDWTNVTVDQAIAQGVRAVNLAIASALRSGAKHPFPFPGYLPSHPTCFQLRLWDDGEPDWDFSALDSDARLASLGDEQVALVWNTQASPAPERWREPDWATLCQEQTSGPSAAGPGAGGESKRGGSRSSRTRDSQPSSPPSQPTTAAPDGPKVQVWLSERVPPVAVCVQGETTVEQLVQLTLDTLRARFESHGMSGIGVNWECAAYTVKLVDDEETGEPDDFPLAAESSVASLMADHFAMLPRSRDDEGAKELLVLLARAREKEAAVKRTQQRQQQASGGGDGDSTSRTSTTTSTSTTTTTGTTGSSQQQASPATTSRTPPESKRSPPHTQTSSPQLSVWLCTGFAPLKVPERVEQRASELIAQVLRLVRARAEKAGTNQLDQLVCWDPQEYELRMVDDEETGEPDEDFPAFSCEAQVSAVGSRLVALVAKEESSARPVSRLWGALCQRERALESKKATTSTSSTNNNKNSSNNNGSSSNSNNNSNSSTEYREFNVEKRVMMKWQQRKLGIDSEYVKNMRADGSCTTNRPALPVLWIQEVRILSSHNGRDVSIAFQEGGPLAPGKPKTFSRQLRAATPEDAQSIARLLTTYRDAARKKAGIED